MTTPATRRASSEFKCVTRPKTPPTYTAYTWAVSRWLDTHWPDTGVEVSGRVSIDIGVGVSGDGGVGVVSGSGVEVSSQGLTICVSPFHSN